MRIVTLLALLIALAGCKKNSTSDFLWSKSYGDGVAYDSDIAPDSLFAIAGVSNDSPLFIKTIKGASAGINYSPDLMGGYTSVIAGEESFFLAGYSSGNLLLTSLDLEGEVRWDTIITTAGNTAYACMQRYVGGSYIVTASCHPDSLSDGPYAVVLVADDGTVQQFNEVSPGFQSAITGITVGSNDFIYVSITRNNLNGKGQSSVARITDEGAIVWERELYNNQNFGAGSLAIAYEYDTVYVSGRTELNVSDGVLENSFVAAVSTCGVVGWKRYLESSNSGTDLVVDSGGNLLMLNRNCFILNFIPLPGGDGHERMRVFDACDSYETSSHGMSVNITYDNNYFIAGSRSGKFYYALREGNIEGNK